MAIGVREYVDTMMLSIGSELVYTGPELEGLN